MAERKQLIAKLSNFFIALPGGFGTIDEITEMITWNQLGIHAKPIALINVNGFYSHFVNWIDNAVSEGFICQVFRNAIVVEEDPDIAINKLLNIHLDRQELFASRTTA